MGRRHLSRLLLAPAAAALFAQAAAGALPYHVLATGRTEGRGGSLHAYVSLSRSPAWASRVSPQDRAAVAAVDVRRREVAAVFLDGRICGSDPEIAAFTRARGTVRVKVAYTKPPIGVATCIRQDTPYIVFTFARTGVPASHISAAAVARA